MAPKELPPEPAPQQFEPRLEAVPSPEREQLPLTCIIICATPGGDKAKGMEAQLMAGEFGGAEKLVTPAHKLEESEFNMFLNRMPMGVSEMKVLQTLLPGAENIPGLRSLIHGLLERKYTADILKLLNDAAGLRERNTELVQNLNQSFNEQRESVRQKMERIMSGDVIFVANDVILQIETADRINFVSHNKFKPETSEINEIKLDRRAVFESFIGMLGDTDEMGAVRQFIELTIPGTDARKPVDLRITPLSRKEIIEQMAMMSNNQLEDPLATFDWQKLRDHVMSIDGIPLWQEDGFETAMRGLQTLRKNAEPQAANRQHIYAEWIKEMTNENIPHPLQERIKMRFLMGASAVSAATLKGCTGQIEVFFDVRPFDRSEILEYMAFRPDNKLLATNFGLDWVDPLLMNHIEAFNGIERSDPGFAAEQQYFIHVIKGHLPELASLVRQTQEWSHTKPSVKGDQTSEVYRVMNISIPHPETGKQVSLGDLLKQWGMPRFGNWLEWRPPHGKTEKRKKAPGGMAARE